MKLLLVEDDRIVRIPVRDALEAAGYAVTACADGSAALRAAESESCDIVLSDVRLPGLDGISLFRRLRQVQPDVAVLLMTAHADTADAVAVMREGARDYILKPFEMDEPCSESDASVRSSSSAGRWRRVGSPPRLRAIRSEASPRPCGGCSSRPKPPRRAT
jgi:DNA-binding response OmpR family regulator